MSLKERIIAVEQQLNLNDASNYKPESKLVYKTIYDMLSKNSVKDHRVRLKVNLAVTQFIDDMDRADKESEEFRRSLTFEEFASDVYEDMRYAAIVRLALAIWDMHHSTEWGY